MLKLSEFIEIKANVDGVCRVVACAQQTLTHSIIVKGFWQTGQWDGSSFKFDLKVKWCAYKFKPKNVNVSQLQLHKFLTNESFHTIYIRCCNAHICGDDIGDEGEV